MYRLCGEKVTSQDEGKPKPSRGTVTTGFEELLSACNIAVFAPVDVGLKPIVTLIELFAGTVKGTGGALTIVN